MSKKLVAVVTGCSSGVGQSAALQLGKNGYTVYATMRNTGKAGHLEKLAGDAFNKSVFVAPMDVANDKSVQDCIDQVLDKEGQIDLLLNNAGMSLFGPIESFSMEEIINMYQANLFGSIRTTRAVLPLMKKRQSGRLVYVSSLGGTVASPFCDAYCGTKFAIEGFVEGLAPVLRQFNIKSVVVAPAAIRSSFIANSQVKHEGLDEKTAQLNERVWNIFMKVFETMAQSSDEVADVIVQKACLDANPPHRVFTNPAYAKLVNSKLTDPSGVSNIDNLEKRWFGQ
eukprot:TRINITY_DN2233_c0_g1_i1.p1 TRINITY_DN2233_c0_g1~~TRINITY_DN2233_c0_g1_i1.p1  ORF type:complete len:283 (+),score=104.13 TRINITY_DN2233_c0_g1_i1:356-1204(+)